MRRYSIVAIAAALLLTGQQAAAQDKTEPAKAQPGKVEQATNDARSSAYQAGRKVGDAASEAGREVKQGAKETAAGAKRGWHQVKHSASESWRSVKGFFAGLFNR